MKQFFRDLMVEIAARHPSNDGKDYPQTWWLMPRRKYRERPVCLACGTPIRPPEVEPQEGCPGQPYVCQNCASTDILPGELRTSWVGCWLAPLLEWLCGKLTGHEHSKTEWGSNGGKFVDRNCRWCDKRIKVPRDEDPPPTKELEDLTGLM